MPSFDIVKEIPVSNSFRVQNVISNFDLDVNHLSEHFTGEIDLSQDWKIGLIVGGSGTGKSTIAKEVFGDAYFNNFEYVKSAVIDDMPSASIKDIEKAFTSVGFASPPSWLKPYSVLSNGEKMRVDLARCILSENDLFVFDEFTSVVDRDVAKTASLAINKAINKTDKKFVAVACHKDIIDWLMPDWIFDTDEMSFFIQRENSTARKSNSKYTGLITHIKKQYGTYLENIII